MSKIHLKMAQFAFTEWLQELDALLLDAQRAHNEAMKCLVSREIDAFGTNLGIMCGKIDQARNAISEGLEQGFEE